MEVSPFLPVSDGLHIERVTASANELLVHVISSSPKACCPLCSVQASRIHSRYTRRVTDLPCVGQVEAQVNRLKLQKRQMYGRAHFDLLRLRVLHRT